MSSTRPEKIKTTRENWLEEHPQFLKLRSYDYEDESRLRTAMLVYLDLIEAKHWFDVEMHRCDALGCVFIVGRPLKKCQREIVVPITCLNSLSHEDIHCTICEVHKEYQNIDLLDISRVQQTVHFAIMEANSTVVYYKMTSGLVPPDEVGEDDPDAELKIKWRKKSNKRF